MITKRVANRMGMCSVAIVAVFWFLALTPVGPKLDFLHDEVVVEIGIMIALLSSIVAVSKGSRWWSLSVIASLATFIMTLLAVE